jgi:hypothetical protein
MADPSKTFGAILATICRREGMLQAIFEALVEVMFAAIFAATGEIILWIPTLGRRKPFEAKNDGSLSALIGLIFWVLIAAGIAIFFLF